MTRDILSDLPRYDATRCGNVCLRGFVQDFLTCGAIFGCAWFLGREFERKMSGAFAPPVCHYKSAQCH